MFQRGMLAILRRTERLTARVSKAFFLCYLSKQKRNLQKEVGTPGQSEECSHSAGSGNLHSDSWERGGG